MLLVDDCEGVLHGYRRLLRLEGMDVLIAADVPSATRLVRATVFDWVVVDLMMPVEGERHLMPVGIDLAEEIRRIAPSTGIVLMTAYPSFEAAAEASGVDASIQWYRKSDPMGRLVALLAAGAPLRHEIPRPDEAARLREHYLTALIVAGGNYTEAARQLEVSRQAVQQFVKSNPPLAATVDDVRRGRRDRRQ